MSSSNRRERELARAKRDRQLARAANTQKKNRYTWSISVASVVVLIVGFILFQNQVFGPKDNPTETSLPSGSAIESALLKNCSTPPAKPSNPRSWDKIPFDEKKVKFATDPNWELITNCGVVRIKLLGTKAPATVQSMGFLSTNGYFDNTPCHRLTTAGLFVLQCGDPTGTGTGDPGYTIPDENLPEAGPNNYPAGTVAMANSGVPRSGGSQFFIVYKDTQLGPNYTIFGQVTSGLNLIEAIANQGVAGGGPDGRPAQPVSILKASFLDSSTTGKRSKSPAITSTASPSASK
ncbi:MAG: hypothetical protein RIS43_718 [Actinomycetota bacterium]|jgi:peptidyl-prolyl cis-trans isomerase B (cyclophilin B)